MFFADAKVQKKMIFQSVLKVYWITENGQNMAKIEKIGNIQIVDNKEDKFFYFPMISMACTGSGYWGGESWKTLSAFSFLSLVIFSAFRSGNKT